MALGINLGAFLIGDKDDEIVDELEVMEVIDDERCVKSICTPIAKK